MTDDPVLTVADLAAFLKMTRNAAYKWARRRNLPRLTGARFRVRRADVERELRARRGPAAIVDFDADAREAFRHA